jgi:hypothetical protein
LCCRENADPDHAAGLATALTPVFLNAFIMEQLFASPSSQPCRSSRRWCAAYRSGVWGSDPCGTLHPGVDLRLVLFKSMNPVAVQGVHGSRGQRTCQSEPVAATGRLVCSCTYKFPARWTWGIRSLQFQHSLWQITECIASLFPGRLSCHAGRCRGAPIPVTLFIVFESG